MKILNWWKSKKEAPLKESLDVKEKRVFPPPTPDYRLADHLVVMRLGNSHHGIFAGNDQVIYYNYYSGFIVEGTLEDFSQGARIKVIYSPVLYSSSAIISRGKSRVGERAQHGFMNRSEQFVRWARGGDVW